MGLPSYAHPIIGECPVIWLNSPFEFTENVFSKLLAVSWEYPNIPKFNLPSFVDKYESPNRPWLFKVRLLTLAVNCPFWPLGNALTSVDTEL